MNAHSLFSFHKRTLCFSLYFMPIRFRCDLSFRSPPPPPFSCSVCLMSRNPVRSKTLWWPLASRSGQKVSTCVLRAFREGNDPAKGEEFIKKRNGSSDVIFVLIPGNPGTPHFYELFLRNIVASSDVVSEAYCIGHTGHTRSTTGATERYESFSYHDQAYHKVLALEEYIFKPGKRVVLCGHSIVSSPPPFPYRTV
jgi:hypothetical protein